jgi:hypothetical protein
MPLPKFSQVTRCNRYTHIENHPSNQLRSVGSNPVGIANSNAKEPINKVGFFVVLYQHYLCTLRIE